MIAPRWCVVLLAVSSIPVPSHGSSGLWPFETRKGDSPLTVKILGNGYAQLQNLEGGEGALGLGLAVDSERVSGRLLINKGSTGTVSGDASKFGRFVLNPGVASVGATASLQWYPGRPAGWLHASIAPNDAFAGFRIAGEIGQADWVVGDERHSSVVFAGVAGPSFQWLVKRGAEKSTQQTNNEVQLFMHFPQFAIRHVGGDAGEGKLEAFRRTALDGVSKRWWYGVQVGGELRINNVFASIEVPVLFGTDVPQLTQGQIILSLGVQGGVDVATLTPGEGTAQAPSNR